MIALEDREFEAEAGQIIVEQGQTGQGFYILRAGAVEVYKNGLLLSVLTFPGTIFGEMGDILGKPRTCTVKARNHCRLVHCAEGDIEMLIRERPKIAMTIMKPLASRLERTAAKLAEQFQEPPMWSVQPEGQAGPSPSP